MASEVTKLPQVGIATPADIAAWKEAHGEAYGYKTLYDGKEHWTYCRVPKLTDIDYANSVGTESTTKFTQALYDSVYLGGSEFAKTDDRIKQGVFKKILKLCKAIEAEEVKL